MNKDDQEFFAAIKKGSRMPLIVSEFNAKNNSEKTSDKVLDKLLRQDYEHWKMFYKASPKTLLLPVQLEKSDKIYYSTEMDIQFLLDLELSESGVEKSLNEMLNKARKEVAFIMSRKETYYYHELHWKKGSDNYKTDLESVIRNIREENNNPRMKIASVIYHYGKTDWLIVGKDRAHLARTTIFIANTHQ